MKTICQKVTTYILALILVLGTIVPVYAIGTTDEAPSDMQETTVDESSDQVADPNPSEIPDEPSVVENNEDVDEDAVSDESSFSDVPVAEGDSDTVVVDNLPDSDELIEGYMVNEAEEELGEDTPQKPSRKRYLDGQSAAIYDYLKVEIQKIAKGERSSTSIEVPVEDFMDPVSCTAADLGLSKITGDDEAEVSEAAKNAFYEKVLTVNVGAISRALQADMPYDLYWYNKADDGTGGVAHRKPGVALDGDSVIFKNNAVYAFNFRVSSHYRSGSDYRSYNVDPEKISATNAAAVSAAAIVDEVSSSYSRDYDKLVSYRDRICQLASYNNNAPSPSTENPDTYGNPWQLIWVFDGDSSTEVVCEGYAKAFKFLCDLTDFNSKAIDCRLVTGDMTVGDKNPEKHMWNVVRMNDGLNYLVDVTNCDKDPDNATSLKPNQLFLKGKSPSGSDKYTLTAKYNSGNSVNLIYVYDDTTKGQYSEAERKLASKDYVVGTADAQNFSDEVAHEHYLVSDKNAVVATCEKAGKTTSKHCSICGKTVVRSEKIEALGHDYGDWEPVDSEQHKRVCAHDESHVETADHTWNDGEVTKDPTCSEEGVMTYTCSVCGHEKTESIEIDEDAHDYGDWESVDGEQHKRVCGHNESHVETADHNWNDSTITKAATCSEEGVKTFTCTDCCLERTESIEIDEDAHDFDEWESIDDSQHKRICKHNESHVETADHNWNDGTITKAATCSEEGVKTYTCTDCGLERTEAIEIDENAHDYGEWESADDSQHKRVCKHNEAHIETVDHSWDNGKITKSATCSEKGIRQFSCTECGAAGDTESIPVADHAWTDVKYTWSSDNKTVTALMTCSHDSTHSKTETVDTVATVTKNATYTAKGQTTYTATFENGAFQKQSRTLTNISQLPKKANTLTVKAKTNKIKFKKLKKKAQTIKVKKGFTISKAQGKVTFKKVGGNAKIKISKAGKITIKKGLKKGKYKIKVKITASGNTVYKPITKTVKKTIIIK